MTKIVAEFASGHGADLEMGKALIRAAKESGADIGKWQSWKAEYVKDSDPDKARYQKYELTDEIHWELKKYSDEIGLEFLTTVTRPERIPFLKSLGLKKVKIASVSLSNTELIKAAVENFEEVIASTAMQDKQTILTAGLILRPSDTLMVCTALYPCPLQHANLERLNWFKDIHASVGYSDHTYGIEAPIVAMSMGITYLEKHFTLSKYLPQTKHQMYENGPYITTHQVANEPSVFKEINKWRTIINKIKGDVTFKLHPEEELIKQRYSGRY